MGIYINPNVESLHGKLDVIKNVSTSVTKEEFINHVPGDDNLWGVCVVDNGPFNAAGVAFSVSEAAAFVSSPNDRRQKDLFLIHETELQRIDQSAYLALLRMTGRI